MTTCACKIFYQIECVRTSIIFYLLMALITSNVDVFSFKWERGTTMIEQSRLPAVKSMTSIAVRLVAYTKLAPMFIIVAVRTFET